VTDFVISLLLIFAGFFGMLLLLLLRFGASIVTPEVESDLDPILGARDPIAIHDIQGPLIPMPSRLKTHAEMVAWMTKELPKLTAEIHKP
jgi:hypothetical protein